MTTGELAIGLGMVAATSALVVATVMLAFVTRQLSKSARQQTRLIERQTDILLENQRLAVDRDKAKLLLRQNGHSVGRVTKGWAHKQALRRVHDYQRRSGRCNHNRRCGGVRGTCGRSGCFVGAVFATCPEGMERLQPGRRRHSGETGAGRHRDVYVRWQ